MYTLPLVISFPLGQSAMHHCNFVLAESSGKSFNHLACEGYFRHKHYGRLPLFQALFDDFHVNLGFTAGSYTMKKKNLLAPAPVVVA